jgi:hypothetical protein
LDGVLFAEGAGDEGGVERDESAEERFLREEKISLSICISSSLHLFLFFTLYCIAFSCCCFFEATVS